MRIELDREDIHIVISALVEAETAWIKRYNQTKVDGERAMWDEVISKVDRLIVDIFEQKEKQ